MEELKCHNCGAPLVSTEQHHIYKCEYCGSMYKVETQKINGLDYGVRYERIKEPGAQTIVTECAISPYELEQFPEEYTSQYAVNRIKEQLVDSLTDYLKLDIHYDPYHNYQIIRGQLRVVPPDFRF